MQPRISVRNTKVSEATKEHISGACEKLEQFCDEIVDCEVMVDKTKAGTSVELVLKVPHQTLTSSSCGDNLFKALAEAQDRMEVQLKKYHGKLVMHR